MMMERSFTLPHIVNIQASGMPIVPSRSAPNANASTVHCSHTPLFVQIVYLYTYKLYLLYLWLWSL